MAQTGEPERAETVVGSIISQGLDTGALDRSSGCTGTSRAATLKPRPWRGQSPNPNLQARALTEVARSLARAGCYQQAETMARSITSPDKQARALAWVAEAMAQDGECERAEAVAGSIISRGLDTGALTEVAAALTRAGCYQQAETMARSITDQNLQAPVR